MCGFVGFIDKIQKNEKENIMKNMLETIVHRGPDSEGIYADNDAALGFRRLSIIDLSDAGTQPFYNEDKTLALVFNGEIYNFQSIRKDLIEKGHVFTSNTDTEVLVHGYEEYGKNLLQKLRGMFAFAIWNVKEKSLFAARDFFGIKPVYYYKGDDGTFIFGSEIKSFLKHPSFRKEINKNALKPYLTFQYSATEETFFKNVYKLPQGHYMEVKDGQVNIEMFYDADFTIEENSLEYYVDAIEKEVVESVKVHQISDVKVGAFLSGGVDSSYIAALQNPEHSFSVGFENPDFDETMYAKEFSEIVGIKNHRKVISPDECFDVLGTIQYHMDEPHSNPSAVPLYFLAKMASEYVTVVLSGEGADELFGGYHWYNISSLMRKYRKLPSGLRKSIRKAGELTGRNRITDFLIRGGTPVEESFIGQALVFPEEEAVDILADDYKCGPSVKSITRPFYNKVKDSEDLIKKQYLDMHLWMPSDILLKADKMSMAHSLELRVPFLDKEVMALAGKIPGDYKVNDHDVKYVFRKAAARKLPNEWATRYKLGFPVPIRIWFKQEKYYNIVKDAFMADYVSEFFNKNKLLKLLEDHYNGITNNARKIYTVYIFLVWYQEYFIKR
ncbi:asparagine synthase (glutamine-hydrolyzing) [Anaerovorax odorimutans]|uniref:asparagine synthase (glutamine-hydrolyzing) n=1 Tax=Anaerovorax odorimutans TaxID=109327 RepID=UPI0003F6B751|nr:asparagine synthase (glutamine-hydrolyzing) [Anaerovorax odorimutans]